MGGQNAVLPCEYFVTDWLDEEIDDYFLSAAKYSAQEKIKLFVDMLLALEALHSYEVFHRDLKADNLRACQKAVRRVVVAIDMGAAARFESGCIQSHYGAPVGAIGYAAPESTCGMAANRLLAPATDYFALGCLLYELFNADYFYHVTRYLNANFDVRLTAMQSEVLGISGDQAQVDAWKRTLAKFSAGVIEVPIDGIGSTVPRGVAGILNEVLAVLTNIDYRKRYSCGKWVRAKLGSALKVIENEALYQRQLSLSRERRRKKILAIAAKRDRLVNFLESRGGNGNSQVT
ncbi:protein kinase domain-containing protein [Lysobacter capsici]|uniref:protein kinase domain-containing protein n=1 Tax=Lysobacter capsici TaxID=435897 RepID=UPI000BBAC2D2|nr:protein kinase [Lysobacter capsici]ATE72417.1 hypothetical protein CNO08_14275 [Lysobacter capsici]